MIPVLELACVDIVPRNLTLAALERNDCRYPYGDGPFVFCGHPVDGGSYCTGHKAACSYIPPQRRMVA